MSHNKDLSFLPEDHSTQRRRGRLMRLGFSLLVIVALVVGVGFFVAENSLTELLVRREAVNRRYEEAAMQIRQFDQLRLRQEELSRRAVLASSLIERMPRSLVLAEVDALRPAGLSLMEVSLRSTPRPVVAPEPGKPQQPVSDLPAVDVSVKLTGLAHNDTVIAFYTDALKRSALVQDVSILQSQQHRVKGELVRRFEIDLRLTESAPHGTSEFTSVEP